MICQEVPDSGFSFQENVDSGKSLYCLDPETLRSTNDLGQAVAACSNSTTGVVGSIMKKTCINYWHDTDENVQTYTSLYTGDLTGGDDDSAADNGNANDIGSSEVQKIKYCYGKTDMYMKGFEWESTTCLVYIFQNWVISTRLALVGACLGTIALGILVEAIIRHRRHLLSSWRNGKKKMFWSASLYGAQLISSYIVMLVVMTYSGPLFISVIVGLVIGHVANNWSEITDERSSRRVGIEGSTPCCANFLDNASGDKKENKSSGENQSKDTSQEDGNDCCHCL
jgi:Ctr copper transporter family.